MSKSGDIVPGGYCKVCDASVMGRLTYDQPIVGDQCGGCGAQTYEALHMTYIPTRHIVNSVAATRYTKFDWCSLEGATKLAKELNGWWHVRGHPQVMHEVISLRGNAKLSGWDRALYGVRSNLVNGCPPKECK